MLRRGSIRGLLDGVRFAVIPAFALVAGVLFAGRGGDIGLGVRAQQPADPWLAAPAPIPVLSASDGTGGAPAKPAKIDTLLDQLARADATRRAGGAGPLTAAVARGLGPEIAGPVVANRLRIDETGRVQVWVDASADVPGAARALAALGLDVQRTDEAAGIVQGLLPVGQLHAAAALPGVRFLRVPQYGLLQEGSVTTQGDGILGTATLRASMNAIDGRGVRVGVISDGMEGMAESQLSGDLGSVDINTCNVVPASGSPPARPLPTDAGAGAEGTAMAEIVHDLAPAASVMFGYFGLNTIAGGTALDFNAAVTCLAQHTDVAVDDLGWFNVGPYNGTSLISANTSAALNVVGNPIRGYYTANGNMALQHYEGLFVNSGFVTSDRGVDRPVHKWSAVAGVTTDGTFGIPCTTGVFCFNTFVVPPDGTATVALEWNDTFGASVNDYDMFLYDVSVNPPVLVSQGTDPQTGSQDPTEEVFASNTDAVNAHMYAFAISRFSGAAKDLNVFLLCPQGCFGNPTNGTLLNFNTAGHSVPSQSDAGGGVVSVGAIGADDPGNDTIEVYSSRGPTADSRIKPDITGIDCVAITGAAGFFNPFCGTSAAAPHIAGMAALLLSCNPTMLANNGAALAAATARTNLRTSLTGGALDLGTVGNDNIYGAGRARMANSAPLAGCTDTDGDGCMNVQEAGTNHQFGGDRSSTSLWDFYDVDDGSKTGTRDRKINFSDVLFVLQHFGHGPTEDAFDNLLDRFIPDALKPWRSAEANNGVDFTDVLANLKSFGDRCAP